ncbi:7047_t:CDS:2 [Gigaspora margarita]|uniref:7047_t:CDS:1 n=1 Tax=Gigaspora margarita TaxID=4874 RepID=A0ABM8VYS1_GIGMA|nr:7047_t:CDS:2 [Gigaspora margarita]
MSCPAKLLQRHYILPTFTTVILFAMIYMIAVMIEPHNMIAVYSKRTVLWLHPSKNEYDNC